MRPFWLINWRSCLAKKDTSSSPCRFARNGIREQEPFDKVPFVQGFGNDLPDVFRLDTAIENVEWFHKQKRFLLAEAVAASDTQINAVTQPVAVEMFFQRLLDSHSSSSLSTRA